jgi:hypothetical protein
MPRLELDGPARLVALYATAAAASSLRVETVAPDGTARVLLAIESFDPLWSEKYMFRTPILLPAGSTLRASHSGVWADLASTRESENE